MALIGNVGPDGSWQPRRALLSWPHGGPHGGLEVRWLGRIAYREAWDLQHELVAKRRAGEIADQLLLLEHPAGADAWARTPDESHVRATADELARRGIEVIRVERGGEVTYHGPGQLVAYPIVRLADRGILLRPLRARAREQAMIDTCAGFGVERRSAREATRAAGATQTVTARASSARSACALRAASPTTASRSTSPPT